MDIDQIPITKFSQITKLSPKSLRIYEDKGLLEPIRDPFNNYRYYGLDQIDEAIKIKLLSNMGFKVEEMKAILNAVNIGDDEFLTQTFNKKQREIQIEIQRLQKLEEIIRSNKPLEMLYMRCTEPEIKTVSKLRVIGKRDLGSYQETTGKLISELMSEIYAPDNRQLVKINGPIMLLVRDLEYKESDADIEVTIPIVGRINIHDENVEVKILEGGEVISVLYTGPYHEIGIGYKRAFDYCMKNNLEVASPTREIYLNDPNKVNEDQLLTEIQFPIHPKKEESQ